MITVRKNVSLKNYTTFKLGGSASWFVTVTTEEELQEAYGYAKEHALRIIPLGLGSNMLVSDAGVDALIVEIALKGISVIEDGGSVFLEIKAGEILDEVVAYAVEKGYWGIENLSHIPGTVGATPVQNVGAYGVEAQDVITAVRVFDTRTGVFTELPASVCAFGYRDSIFKHEEGSFYIITSVTYKLTTHATPRIAYRDLALAFESSEPTLHAIREAVIRIRAGKFPNWHDVGTAGSFFKNPVVSNALFDVLRERYPDIPVYETPVGIKIPLGWILDKVLGLRGHKEGFVEAFSKQALVVVAHEGATTSDVVAFADMVAKKVKDATGITIEWEVTYVV